MKVRQDTSIKKPPDEPQANNNDMTTQIQDFAFKGEIADRLSAPFTQRFERLVQQE